MWANSEVGEADTDPEEEVVSEGECRDNAPMNTPTALSNLIDPFRSHTLVSPHLHARDHHSNALALAQVSEK